MKVDKGVTDLKKGTKFNPRFFILLLVDVIKSCVARDRSDIEGWS